MFIRYAFIGSLLVIFGYASAASANSCANVNVLGTFDQSGLLDNEYGIYAVGTFRIEGEADESKQPMFSLTQIDCKKQSDGTGRASLECTVTQASVYANSDKPSTDSPNCSLDLDISTYEMKELQNGSLVGAGPLVAVTTGY